MYPEAGFVWFLWRHSNVTVRCYWEHHLRFITVKTATRQLVTRPNYILAKRIIVVLFSDYLEIQNYARSSIKMGKCT